MKSVKKTASTFRVFPNGIGIAAAYVISMGLMAFIAMLVSLEYLQENATVFAVAVTQFLSVFFGCMIAAKAENKNVITTCAVVASWYLIVAISIALLFFDSLLSKFIVIGLVQ